jgi:hypothetical protein
VCRSSFSVVESRSFVDPVSLGLCGNPGLCVNLGSCGCVLTLDHVPF